MTYLEAIADRDTGTTDVRVDDVTLEVQKGSEEMNPEDSSLLQEAKVLGRVLDYQDVPKVARSKFRLSLWGRVSLLLETKEASFRELVGLYEKVLHGEDNWMGIFDCYDTYYAGCWDDDLKKILELKKSLGLVEDE